MRQKVRDSLCKGNFLRACRKQSGLILPIAFAIIFVVLLYDFSSQRIIPQNKLSKQSKNTDLILAENMPESMSADKDVNLISRNLIAEISEKNVWCQARDYQDLSNDPVILEFQIWTEQLRNLVCLTEKDSCLDHDPRFLHAFFQ